MTIERPIMHSVAGHGAEQDRAPANATSKPAKTPELVTPEAVRPPPEGGPLPESVEIEIVDVAKLEQERRECKKAYDREYRRRRYHEIKQAALAGDEEAQRRWERVQEVNREGQRRWRKRHPEKARQNWRDYERRKETNTSDGDLFDAT